MAVVRTAGSEEAELKGPGVYFDFYPTHNYQKYTTKTKQLNMSTSVFSKDTLDVQFSFALFYQIRTDDILEIERLYFDEETFEKALTVAINDQVKSSLSCYLAEDVRSKQLEIATQISADLTEVLVTRYHVEVIELVVTRVNLFGKQSTTGGLVTADMLTKVSILYPVIAEFMDRFEISTTDDLRAVMKDQ